MLIKDLTEMPFGKSVRVFEVYPETINQLYERGEIGFDRDELPVYPNQPLILKAGQQSVLALVNRKGDAILRAEEDIEYFKIRGRNKEQLLLQNLFQDPDIRLIVITGAAGTGKTTMIGGYVMDRIMSKKAYKRLLLSKPLEIVTSTKYWGTVPGGEDDKFSPFLKSYQIMFEGITGDDGTYVSTAMQHGIIKFFPLELMRGASLKNCICWFDEAQNLNHHEMNTLGSRMDDVGKSKLILSGDLNQQDRRGMKNGNTGLHKLLTSDHFLKSPHTAHVHLVQNERGVLSQLFFDVFDRKE